MDEKVQKIFRKQLQNMIVRERGMIQGLPEEDKDVMELLDRVSTVGLCAASNCSTLLGRNNFTICLGEEDNPRRRSTEPEIEGWYVASDRAEFGCILMIFLYLAKVDACLVPFNKLVYLILYP